MPPRPPLPDILGQTAQAADDVALAMGGAPEPAQVVTPFNYDDLDPETRIIVQQRTSEIKAIARQTAQGVLDIGAKLAEVKDRLGHGRFGYWLDQEFGWSDRTARSFMAAARSFKTEIISDLSIAPTALVMLASPSVPEAARQQALQLATNGLPVNTRQARQIIDQHRPAPAPKPPAAPSVTPVESPDPYTAIRTWLSGRFQNDGQRRFALLDLLKNRAASQYWPSIARLLPDTGESDVLVALDAARADLDGNDAPPTSTPRSGPSSRSLGHTPAPAPRWESAEERLDELRRRLADILFLPYSASDDQLVEAVETAVTAWRLMEER
jgi:hypothetical protein